MHAKGSFIFLQLGALGRAANSAVLQTASGGPYDVVAPSAIPIDSGNAIPRALSIEEIREYVQLFAQAAQNAVLAGFDGTWIVACYNMAVVLMRV